MPPNDNARREFYSALEATMGSSAADIMMDHLPPHGWGDLATRNDLNHGLDLLAEKLRHEFSQSMNRQTWRLIGFTLAIHTATIGVTVALVNQLG